MKPTNDQIFWNLVPGCDVCQSMRANDVKGTQQNLPCRCGYTGWYHNAHHPHTGLLDACNGFQLSNEHLVELLTETMKGLEKPPSSQAA